MSKNDTGYRVDRYGDDTYRVYFVNAEGEKHIGLPGFGLGDPFVMHSMMEVEKAIAFDKRIRKAKAIVSTTWYDKEGNPL